MAPSMFLITASSWKAGLALRWRASGFTYRAQYVSSHKWGLEVESRKHHRASSWGASRRVRQAPDSTVTSEQVITTKTSGRGLSLHVPCRHTSARWAEQWGHVLPRAAPCARQPVAARVAESARGRSAVEAHLGLLGEICKRSLEDRDHTSSVSSTQFSLESAS